MFDGEMIRKVARLLLPPVLMHACRKMRSNTHEWRALAPNSSWPSGSGWSDPKVVAVQKSKWNRLLEKAEGTRVLDFNPEANVEDWRNDLYAQGHWYMIAYALSRTAKNGHCRMIDYGSGLGQFGVILRALLPEIELEYVGIDLPEVIAEARVCNTKGAFYSSEEYRDIQPADFMLASSSLQYNENWEEQLALLAGLSLSRFFITRTLVTDGDSDFICVQNPGAVGYGAEYAGWVFSEKSLPRAMKRLGFELEREMLIWPGPIISGHAERVVFKGYLFLRKTMQQDLGRQL
jgi:putative methyltransferase (TIGR04325 family)